LLRLAHQLTGDPGIAERLVVAACAHVARTRSTADDLSLDERLTRALLRALPRRVSPVTPSPLDRLARSVRIATVLAFSAGWDAAGIADATRVSTRRTRARVGAALTECSQEEWERALAAPLWRLPVPASLLDDIARDMRRDRSERRLRALGGAAVALAAVGAVTVVARTVTAPAPLPPTAHEAGLLAWPPRGDLVRDHDLLVAAERLWRAQPSAPPGRIYVLWAGRVGVGRLVVLEARDASRTPSVAVVADHDVTFGHARLHVDVVTPIAVRDPALLLVPYDGNLNVAGLQSGPSQQVMQLLVRPGVDFVDERSSTAPVTVPSLRPAFRARPLTDGMSQPWLDVRGDQPTTAVRAWSHGRVVFTGLVGPAAAGAAVRPTVTGPPAAWAGLPRSLAPSALDDDALWWAQVCHHPSPAVSLVWADPTSPTRSRMEFVSCPGGSWAAQYVSDGSEGAEWGFTRVLRSTAAVVGRLPRSGLLVVVCDRSVATVVVGTNRFVGRTFEGPWPASTPLRVLDAHGRQLPL
jgi:hypothetical protein